VFRFNLIGAALNVCSLYMVPGSLAPLHKVCTGGDNLLLLYGDDRARLWDVKTLQFWRSMNMEKAKELLSQGGWTELSVTVYIVAVSVTFSLPGRSLHDMPPSGSAHSTLSAFTPDSCMSHAPPFMFRQIDLLAWKLRRYWWI
jgi:hypothetical protein